MTVETKVPFNYDISDICMNNGTFRLTASPRGIVVSSSDYGMSRNTGQVNRRRYITVLMFKMALNTKPLLLYQTFQLFKPDSSVRHTLCSDIYYVSCTLFQSMLYYILCLPENIDLKD